MSRDVEFELLVHRVSRPMLRLATAVAGDRSAAEEIVQGALVSTYKAWRRGALENPDAYVTTAVTRRALRWRRSRWRELPTSVLSDDRCHPDIAGQIAERDSVWRGLGLLTRRQRAVLVLRYMVDMPVSDVAHVLRCSESSVTTHAARGLEQLRRAFESSPERLSHNEEVAP